MLHLTLINLTDTNKDESARTGKIPAIQRSCNIPKAHPGTLNKP